MFLKLPVRALMVGVVVMALVVLSTTTALAASQDQITTIINADADKIANWVYALATLAFVVGLLLVLLVHDPVRSALGKTMCVTSVVVVAVMVLHVDIINTAKGLAGG